MSRTFLIVLDSFGCGEMPDAADFGDFNVNTLKTVSGSEFFNAPNLSKLGLFNIDGVDFHEKEKFPIGAYARLKEVSKGKDTTTGHWEIAGVRSLKPMPTFPNGFPDELIDEFTRVTGLKVLCNKTYSGTKVINDYGDEHVKTGFPIVYTSADSVFQIAAHEDVIPVNELYDICRKARGILKGDYGVGRVIARPFIGTSGNYTRTERRHDFSLEPTGVTMLDELKKTGKDVLAVGKINDIFAGRGITEFVYTANNAEGIERTLEWMDRDFDGLCFTNLVDTDMLYGHRRDIKGYAEAISYFDKFLPKMMSKLKDEDILMITADHGCDPGYLKTTDHTREYIPLLVYGKGVKPVNYGTRDSFTDIAVTICKYNNITPEFEGTALFTV